MSRKEKASRSFLIFLGTLLLSSCTPRSNSSGKVVNLAIWGNYLSEDIQKKFTEETSIQLNVTNYSSNEELLAKVQMGASGFDIAVPSDYMVEIMRKLDLLSPLDHSRLNVLFQMDKNFLNRDFDPQNIFSVPYAWTMTGIAVHKSLYKKPINSWKDFFENKELEGKISVLDDARESLGALLKENGFSVNTTQTSELKKTEEDFKRFKKQIKVFTSDTVEILKNKEVFAAQSYSSDALIAKKETQGQIDFVVPQDGSTMAIDNFVIFKGSKNIDQAYRFIQFILQKDINKKLVEEKMFGPVVSGVADLLPENLKNSPALFPKPETLQKLESIKDLGDKNKLYEDVWMKVKL